MQKNESPFDVFICYKETDNEGKRTVDSVIANEIYHQLVREGFKVFYAPITLENKLGEAYEPYIFAALNSAKVMLVVGTRPEFFNAVWVRNEWSRFARMAKSDRSKLLIPCYKDMNPYDLPDEFAYLQAQDMGKIGFINDVIHGVKKVVPIPSVNNDQEISKYTETIVTTDSEQQTQASKTNAGNEPRQYFGIRKILLIACAVYTVVLALLGSVMYFPLFMNPVDVKKFFLTRSMGVVHIGIPWFLFLYLAFTILLLVATYSKKKKTPMAIVCLAVLLNCVYGIVAARYFTLISCVLFFPISVMPLVLFICRSKKIALPGTTVKAVLIALLFLSIVWVWNHAGDPQRLNLEAYSMHATLIWAAFFNFVVPSLLLAFANLPAKKEK